MNSATGIIATLDFLQELEQMPFSWKNIREEDRRIIIQTVSYVGKKKKTWSTS